MMDVARRPGTRWGTEFEDGTCTGAVVGRNFARISLGKLLRSEVEPTLAGLSDGDMLRRCGVCSYQRCGVRNSESKKQVAAVNAVHRGTLCIDLEERNQQLSPVDVITRLHQLLLRQTLSPHIGE